MVYNGNKKKYNHKKNNYNRPRIGEKEISRINRLIRSQVNFISGTVSPATSNKDENNLQIEDLGIGLKLLWESYEKVLQLSIQPKYMGSRCNLYLNNEDVSKSYAVSRNGYVISKVELTEVFHTIHNRLKNYLDENKIKMIILDGELLPWKAIGSGLINSEFRTVDVGVMTEYECMEEYQFDQNYKDMVNSISEDTKNDYETMEKKDFIEKYNQNVISKCDVIKMFKPEYKNVAEMKNLHEVYHKQMDLYGNDAPLEYKAFSILKIIYQDGSEEVPLLEKSMGQGEMYDLICGDKDEDQQLVVHLHTDNFDEVLNNIKTWFNTKTMDQGFEGIILKPEFVNEDSVPMIKVRNPEYLTIIYGFDYTSESRLKNLVMKKTTSRKLKQSANEFKLGLEMLRTKYGELDTDEYRKILERFLFAEHLGSTLDPRL